jgi:hypothetical protein
VVTFLKTVGVLFCMSLIIPLYVWGGSGSWRYALYSLKWYWLCMGIIAVPALVAAGVTLLPLLF